MAYQSIFRRYENKYLLTYEQKNIMLSAIEPYMQLDKYGRTTIRNIYFDNDSYQLIRRSIEKPEYKEKLRIRSYSKADPDSPVFVELKKKYDGVVYKRRIFMPEREAMNWLVGGKKCPLDTQISREIDYFTSFYGRVFPSVFLSYEREAFFEKGGGDLRITFDDNILCRQNDVSLCSDPYGDPVLPDGYVMMEIKCPGAIPLWLVEVLSREKIYKTSFSKYGKAYEQLIFPKILAHRNSKKEILLNV